MVWGAVTGALDHAAGSVDESIGRQFDDEPGGGFADITETGESNDDGLAGGGEDAEYHNRYLQGDAVRTAYDTVFDYEGTLNGEEDTADVFGPSVGGVADAAVDVKGEETSAEERKAQLWLYAGAALVALYFGRPLLRMAADFTGGSS
ncbi:hypothetical protein [Haloarcula onubensis]|uniref:Uncharacterized protein n=1 Tax=Haloarcula onubensis TaxID=2950539 RepID=A0ABU2FJV9_9EURY|nr:hypothetical protein [Halomicroarcula sp. S3CR25-11]MDS0280631.1 hypothetical protein [Halomicroarcula sp. S3CR25-11]